MTAPRQNNSNRRSNNHNSSNLKASNFKSGQTNKGNRNAKRPGKEFSKPGKQFNKPGKQFNKPGSQYSNSPKRGASKPSKSELGKYPNKQIGKSFNKQHGKHPRNENGKFQKLDHYKPPPQHSKPSQQQYSKSMKQIAKSPTQTVTPRQQKMVYQNEHKRNTDVEIDTPKICDTYPAEMNILESESEADDDEPLIISSDSDDNDDDDNDDDVLESAIDYKTLLKTSAKIQADMRSGDRIIDDTSVNMIGDDDDDTAQETVTTLLDNSLNATDLNSVKEKMQDIARCLTNWHDFVKQHIGTDTLDRSHMMNQLVDCVNVLYGYNKDLALYIVKLFGHDDALEFFESNEQKRPLTLRTNMLKTRRRELAQILIRRGANVDPLADWTKTGLKVYDSSVSVGATPEYCAGHYMLQSASSLIPVIALAPQPGDRVLDMAAAPGGKSTHIGQLMKNNGILVCNEVNRDRCVALCANLQRCGINISICTNCDGRRLNNILPKFDRVLLDAPCSGLGIISRDPSVKAERRPDDLKSNVQLQKELLRSAIDLVKDDSPNGIVVYSTCSISVEENEAVINYVLRKRNVKLVPLGIEIGVPGFKRFESSIFHPSMVLTRRIYPHIHNMDGFFVAKLKKLGPNKNAHQTNNSH